MLKEGFVVDGKYKILKKIGQGGMSVVYLAVNERANKLWAVKEVHNSRIQDYDMGKKSLAEEIEFMKHLRHPCIPSIIDVIEKDEDLLIVMDYIEGESLSKVLNKYGPQPQNEVILWAIQLCDVLEYLHSKNPPIIYRDMKPSNVMLKPDGKVMLIDFGAARTYKKNNISDTDCLGTRGYAAPEQYEGHGQTNARTDIYCLGATMYHLLTGHNPGEEPYGIHPIRRWNPKLSSGLEEIIVKCTRKNSSDRYENCSELKFELEHYSKLEEKQKWKQKKRQITLLAVGILTIAVSFSACYFHMAESRALKRLYKQCLSEAESSINKKEQIKLFEKAIQLRPEEGDAYNDLLSQCFLDDSLFTEEEDRELRKILNTSKKGFLSNESCFKKNKPAYEEFSYQAAIAYFYYFENSTEQKNGALKWLHVVKTACTLDKKRIERGERLEKIAQYYSSIGIEKLEGDSSISYLEYWNDMVELTKGNLAIMDNEKTALVMYGEFISQIYTNCKRFIDSGVNIKTIFNQINEIEIRINTDLEPEQKGSKTLTNQIKAVQSNINQCRKVVMTVYNQQQRAREDRIAGDREGNRAIS